MQELGHDGSDDYDALDRPTLITYPDGSTEQFSYQKTDGTKILEMTHFKDRENRWTFHRYNALRQRISTLDPAGQNTQFVWCYCGSLQELIDGAGNVTKWSYDIGARLTGKTFADGRQESYTYDLAGRLDKITDAKGQVKTHSYFRDNQLSALAYTNSPVATANVSFTYDSIYGRLATMNDGTGVTTFAYHPNNGASFGAGRLKSIDSPMANDLIEFSYDAQGRFKSRSINGTATTTISTYDNLGRVLQLSNPLGTFQNTYDPINLLPKTTTAPNGMITEFSYENATADLRLKEIKHTLAANLPLAKHNYTYSKNGNIHTWQQTLGANPGKTWTLGYDAIDQLTSGSSNDGDSTLESYAFQYDKAGNRTSHQRNSAASQSTHNNVNQITGNAVGGKLRVTGRTNEAAKVKVNGTSAKTNAANFYEAWVDVAAGQNILTIEAEDFSPQKNKATRSWTVNITGTAPAAPTYDANGNITNNGLGQTYQWDAENRLVKITYADASSTEYAYNGLSQRVRITEKNAANAITSDKRYLWADSNQAAEERAADGITIHKRYFEEGEQRIGGSDAGNYYYAKDHLGSVREITNSSGAVAARYDYGLWGKRTKLSGNLDTKVGYTSHHHHTKSGLITTLYRFYDSETGRWLSRDPLGEEGGINLYGYVGNDPVNFYDPDGLNPKPSRQAGEVGGGGAGGAWPSWGGGSGGGGFRGAGCGGLGNWGHPRSGIGKLPISKPATPTNLPGIGKGWVKLRGSQGWRDAQGNIWKKDKLHKDHYDVSDQKGNKIKEVDFNGNQIWPNGDKNKNKCK